MSSYTSEENVFYFPSNIICVLKEWWADGMLTGPNLRHNFRLVVTAAEFKRATATSYPRAAVYASPCLSLMCSCGLPTDGPSCHEAMP